MRFHCKNRNDIGTMIAVYCSMPALFLSNSGAKSHLTLGTGIALCVVLGIALFALFLCRKRRTAA